MITCLETNKNQYKCCWGHDAPVCLLLFDCHIKSLLSFPVSPDHEREIKCRIRHWPQIAFLHIRPVSTIFPIIFVDLLSAYVMMISVTSICGVKWGTGSGLGHGINCRYSKVH